jgi:hypothetical protein
VAERARGGELVIDRTKSDRVVFTCPHELRREVAAYRRVQEGFPSESKVIVDLLWQALRRWREEQFEETPAKPAKRRTTRGRASGGASS